MSKQTYIALLRGINVGGQKKILMKDLAALFKNIGFENIKTYIQSGNVIFQTTGLRPDGKRYKPSDLSAKIESAIEAAYGWQVPVLVKTPVQLKKAVTNCPFSEEKMIKSYFTLLFKKPSQQAIDELNALSFPNEEFHIVGDCMHYYCATGYAKAKMSNNIVERKLKVRATSRNYRTMMKLIELAEAI